MASIKIFVPALVIIMIGCSTNKDITTAGVFLPIKAMSRELKPYSMEYAEAEQDHLELIRKALKEEERSTEISAIASLLHEEEERFEKRLLELAAFMFQRGMKDKGRALCKMALAVRREGCSEAVFPDGSVLRIIQQSGERRIEHFGANTPEKNLSPGRVLWKLMGLISARTREKDQEMPQLVAAAGTRLAIKGDPDSIGLVESLLSKMTGADKGLVCVEYGMYTFKDSSFEDVRELLSSIRPAKCDEIGSSGAPRELKLVPVVLSAAEALALEQTLEKAQNASRFSCPRCVMFPGQRANITLQEKTVEYIKDYWVERKAREAYFHLVLDRIDDGLVCDFQAIPAGEHRIAIWTFVQNSMLRNLVPIRKRADCGHSGEWFSEIPITEYLYFKGRPETRGRDLAVETPVVLRYENSWLGMLGEDQALFLPLTEDMHVHPFQFALVRVSRKALDQGN